MRNIIICTAAVLGMVFVGATQVEAGSRHGGHHGYSGHRGHSFNRGYSGHLNHNRYSWGGTHSNSYYGGHNVYHRAPVYHNTSHYDYHGPSLQRHGYHLDYVPGHYDAHRSGHYDF